jgi:hypothetical protein
MAKRVTNDFRRYAVVGAEQRLSELATEAAQIFAAFPELRAAGRGFAALRRRGSRSQPGTASAGQAPAKRRRRKMSAAARKRISDAQKARWAKQRAAKK